MTGSARVVSRLGLAGFLLVISFGSLYAKTNYKKWLREEVVWIISKAEREEFESLKGNKAKDEFIVRFWGRRDPTPSTERNEYKEEHYRRLTYANKVFREGIPGWKADRGRVYILHGPPDSESFFKSRSTVNPLGELPHTARNPNTLVWTYHQLPDAKYYKGEILAVFQPISGMGRQDLALSDSRTAQQRASQISGKFFPAVDPNMMEADVRFKLVMVGPPSLVNAAGAELPTAGGGEQASYLEDLLRSPGELVEEWEREVKRRERARQEMKDQLVKAEVSFNQLPLEAATQSYYRSGAEWLIPLQLDVLKTDLQEGKLDVYAALYDAGGEIFDEFIDSLEIDQSVLTGTPAENIRYYNTFSAPSGTYKIKFFLRDLASKRTGYREMDIELNDSYPKKLDISSILVTNRVEAIPESTPEEDGETASDPELGDTIIFNNARLLPSPTHRFSTTDYLFLYFQAWVPEQTQEISLNANFILDGAIARRLTPRKIPCTGKACIEYGTMIPLKGFAPGGYTLQIQAVDRLSKTFDIQRATFSVVGQPAPQPAGD